MTLDMNDQTLRNIQYVLQLFRHMQEQHIHSDMMAHIITLEAADTIAQAIRESAP